MIIKYSHVPKHMTALSLMHGEYEEALLPVSMHLPGHVLVMRLCRESGCTNLRKESLYHHFLCTVANFQG